MKNKRAARTDRQTDGGDKVFPSQLTGLLSRIEMRKQKGIVMVSLYLLTERASGELWLKVDPYLLDRRARQDHHNTTQGCRGRQKQGAASHQHVHVSTQEVRNTTLKYSGSPWAIQGVGAVKESCARPWFKITDDVLLQHNTQDVPPCSQIPFLFIHTIATHRRATPTPPPPLPNQGHRHLIPRKLSFFSPRLFPIAVWIWQSSSSSSSLTDVCTNKRTLNFNTDRSCQPGQGGLKSSFCCRPQCLKGQREVCTHRGKTPSL